MSKTKKRLKLNKDLFWDVKISDIDRQKNKEFVVGRILNLGDIDDYKIANEFYGKKHFQNIAKKVPWLDKKSLNFWSLIFNIPKNEFICSRKLLRNKHNAFLNR